MHLNFFYALVFLSSLMFSQLSLATTVIVEDGQTVTTSSSDTISLEDSSSNPAGIYVSGKSGVNINNSFDINIISSGTVDPYGIGVLKLGGVSSTVNSMINTGNINSYTSGTVLGDGNAYGIMNEQSTITSINNSGNILGYSSGYGTARGINNTNGIITTLTNSGAITGTGTLNSGRTASYGTYNGVGLYNHGDNDGSLGSLKSTTINTLINTGTISGSRTAISNSASSAYNTTNINSLVNSGIISTSVSSVTGETINGESNTTNAILVSATGNGSSAEITTLTNTGTIKTVASGVGAYAIVVNNGGTIATINNSGTISSGTASIAINSTGSIGAINLNEESVLIGDIYSLSSTSYTLNMNVGAAKSYYIATSGTGSFIVNDLDNRPVVTGSAYAINIGSMEMAGENLFQKMTNIKDAISRNVKSSQVSWFEPYYSETTRDSNGSSSEIRKFKSIKQGFNSGWKKDTNEKLIEIIFNFDQANSTIDDGEYNLESESLMLGLASPNFASIAKSNLSLNGLIGFSESNTARKLLDSTSSTGERILTGDYYTLYASVGTSLSKNINFSKNSNVNLTLGADLNTELRESYRENLYNAYNQLFLVQFQPRIEVDYKIKFSEKSNVFLKAGVEAREIISGKKQNYSMGGTKVSYKTPTSRDIYGSVSAGTNINLAENIDFFAFANAKSSSEDVKSYQASIGIRRQF